MDYCVSDIVSVTGVIRYTCVTQVAMSKYKENKKTNSFLLFYVTLPGRHWRIIIGRYVL